MKKNVFSAFAGILVAAFMFTAAIADDHKGGRKGHDERYEIEAEEHHERDSDDHDTKEEDEKNEQVESEKKIHDLNKSSDKYDDETKKDKQVTEKRVQDEGERQEENASSGSFFSRVYTWIRNFLN
jgi:hypothetical protein